MNTERSDKFAKEWAGKAKPLKRATVSMERTFSTSPERLFRLLCPTTELDWIPGWHCDLLHSQSGYAEYNAVFRTDFFGPEEIWICTRYEPNKAIEYSRTAEDVCMKLDIGLTDNCDGTVTGRWVTTASALNEEGNKFVSGLEAQEAALDVLEHYVNTGEMRA